MLNCHLEFFMVSISYPYTLYYITNRKNDQCLTGNKIVQGRRTL